MAIGAKHRVIEEPLEMAKPIPSNSLPAELLYEIAIDGSTPARPGGTAIGIVNAASPESVVAKDTGIVPGTIVIDF